MRGFLNPVTRVKDPNFLFKPLDWVKRGIIRDPVGHKPSIGFGDLYTQDIVVLKSRGPLLLLSYKALWGNISSKSYYYITPSRELDP